MNCTWAQWAARSQPAPGELQCGDQHLVRAAEDHLLAAVVDGLGHGPKAAAASEAAVRMLQVSESREPEELMESLHLALAGTRGAAVSLLGLEPDGQLTWAGVGNVEGATVGPDGRTRRLQTGNGIVGQRLGSVRSQRVKLEAGATVLLVTDGVSPDFLDGYPALVPVAQLPERILQRHALGTDDALVLALRFHPAGRPQ